MSHFAVAVFTESGDYSEVVKLLAPFQENNMGDCPKEYLKFIEDEDFDVDEETGKHGYWENPNAKWDWYSIGGRAHGLLIAKAGKRGKLGERSFFGAPAEKGTYDSMKVEDIDFDAMREQAKKSLTPFDSCWERRMYKPEYFQKKYPDEETYVRMNTEFSTYACVTPDGEWHAPGTMGWWGIDDAKPEEKSEFLGGYFEKFIKPAIENGWHMTIVDCHI